MKQKFKTLIQKIFRAPVFHKKPLYLVLTIVLSILLLADVAMAVLVPDTSSMGNMQDMQSMQKPGSFDGSNSDGTDDTDTDNSGSDADDANTESDSSDNTEEITSDSSENEASDHDDTSNENTDSDSSTDMSAGSSDATMPSGGRGERSSDSSSEDGEMPDMGDGEMPDMSSYGDNEMPDMENGEMPDMGSGNAPSFGDKNSDDSTDSGADSEEGSDSDETDSADSENGRSFDNSNFAAAQNSGLSALRILRNVRSHWLMILIILAILDAGSIFMLIRISRREKKQRQEEEKALREQAAAGEIVRKAQPAKKESKHSHYLWIIALILIVLLVVLVKIFTRQTTSSGTETEATTYTEAAATGSIDTVLPGTGTLEEEESEDLSLPEEVEITEWYVSDGDTVEEGDTLAAVDQVSVMTAIATVQENLASLDEALEGCEDDAVSETITAAADGRVIKIYASADTAVVDTMYENSALMLLSLDGYMAVSIETDAEISTGDSVDVTLSDGTTVTGKVESLTNTTAVIVISDDGPELGDTVTVEAEGGTAIGEGTLYIHSELKVTGYTGTVSSVSVSEGDEVDSGDTLLKLTDTDYSAKYETLLEQRAELETQMETLFRLYEDGYIYASCSGVISGLDSSSSSDTSTSATDEDSDTSTGDGTTESTSSSDDSDSSASSSGSDTSGESDSSSSASASETSASGSSGYTVSTLSVTGGASTTYLTISSNQGVSAALTSGTDSSSAAAGSSSVVSSSSSSGSTDDSDGGSSADGSSGTDDSSDGSSSDDSTSTDAENTTVQIGIVQSVSGDTVTLSLLSGGTTTVSLSDLSTVGIYQNGNYNSSGAVNDIAEGDVLILTCIGNTVSSATCISTSGTTSDAGNFTGETGNQESGGSDLTGNQSDASDQANGSAQTDETGQEGSSSGENSMTGQVSDESESDMTSDASSMTASADTATDAETAASEALTEEVESTYGVDETTLLAITPQDTITLEITVDEMDILSVEVGQEAAITLDAFPGQSFTGTVTSINKSGSNSGGSSKYTAVITMDREDDMLAGMNASAKITLSTTEDVLIIPEAALVEEDGTTYVYTTYDEETDTLGGLTEVTTGASDGTNVEITSGLEEGDTYCYSVLDVVNYSSSYSSSGSGGSFSIESLFGSGGGRGGF